MHDRVATYRRLLLSCCAVALALAGLARAADYVSPSEARMRADVAYLADDEREGRGPNTKGLEAASEYIANAFREIGLKPAPGADGYFQPFTFQGEPRLGEDNALVVRGPGDATFEARLRDDFTPLNLGGPGELKGLPIAFAGYSITAKDAELKLEYDDYRDLDAKGKAVLIIRREPQLDDENSPFAGTETTSHATLRQKVLNAADHGAAAVLLVNDKAGLRGEPDRLLPFEVERNGGRGIPVAMISREFADKLLAAAGAPKLEELEAQIDADLKPRSEDLGGLTLDLTVSIDRTPIKVRNVIGVLEGAGPLAEETIVVGAHYDHLGRGGSGSLAMGSRDIHNGADDNASGTAMMIELARRLARRVDPLPRRIVFIAFSAEERGLLGSRYYVNEAPLFPLEKTVAMVNFDMVGRLNGENELILFGARSSPGLEELVAAVAKNQGLKANIVPGQELQFGASDHASFYQKDIPVLFAFTGTHPDYHRPTDDTEKINFTGMTRIADFGELVLLDLARRPERPAFTKLARSTPGPLGSPGRRGNGAYLGTIPSYGEADVTGVKLDGVTEGSPAEKAGLKGGDIIVKFDGKTVRNVEDYFNHIMTKKPGDEVEVVVKRGEEEVPLKVKLGSRTRQN